MVKPQQHRIFKIQTGDNAELTQSIKQQNVLTHWLVDVS
jgi:hypothetical protein